MLLPMIQLTLASAINHRTATALLEVLTGAAASGVRTYSRSKPDFAGLLSETNTY